MAECQTDIGLYRMGLKFRLKTKERWFRMTRKLSKRSGITGRDPIETPLFLSTTGLGSKGERTDVISN